jgi:putative ABC transport system permease protein
VNLLIGAITEGFIFAPLALGLLLSYRVFAILDLTVDGSFGVGAAVTAALLVRGLPPATATFAGALAGAGAGAVTAALHIGLRASPSLVGVLVTTALYSVILFTMGGGNLSLASTRSLSTVIEGVGQRVFGMPDTVTLLDTPVSGGSISMLVAMGFLATAFTLGMVIFLRTELGVALRAAGGNPQMARAVAIEVEHMLILGLAISNASIALSGALFSQFQGHANIQNGSGAVVTGLATLTLGEALLGRRTLWRAVASALVGALAFRLLIAGAIRAGLDPDALKLITALLVLLVLLVPRLTPLLQRRVPVLGARQHA